MSYSELTKMPVRYRHWYLQRLTREFEEKSNKRKNNSPHDNYSNEDTKKGLDMINAFEQQFAKK